MDISRFIAQMVECLSVLLVASYMLTRLFHIKFLETGKMGWREKVWLILVFGLLSIYGTLGGFPFKGSVLNLRDLAPVMAGILHGPVIGIGAAIIGAIHRIASDKVFEHATCLADLMKGSTCIPCSLATLVSGLTGGLIWWLNGKRLPSVRLAAFAGGLVAVFHMGIVFTLQYDDALKIYAPMWHAKIIVHAGGAALFVFIVHNILDELNLRRDKAAMEKELNIARDIQLGLIPSTFPPFPDRDDIELHGLIRPAREVGGDFYDFFMLDEDYLCLAIGDVSGKGVPASLFMAVTRTLLRAHARMRVPPAEALKRINNQLARDNDSCMFTTMFLAIVSLKSGLVHYANGGHNAPILVRKGKASLIECPPGCALGPFEGVLFEDGKIQTQPGDVLLFYTDGVTEAHLGEQALFGEEKLLRLAENAASLGDMNENIYTQVMAYQKQEQFDDVTLLAWRNRNGQSPVSS